MSWGLRTGLREGSVERGPRAGEAKRQVVRVTVIVRLSFCISVWLYNCNCVALGMPVWSVWCMCDSPVAGIVWLASRVSL